MFLGTADETGDRWSARDRELAKALVLFEASLCPGCGHSKSETWVESEDSEFDYIAEEMQCLTCARLEDARSGNKTQKGLHYWIERRPRGSAMRDHEGHVDER